MTAKATCWRSLWIPVVALGLVLGPMVLAGQGKGGKGGNGGGGGGSGGGGGGPADPAILFVVGDDIAVMDADGGNPTLVLANTGNVILEPCFTPDGTQVLFNGNLSQGPGVYKVNLDGSGLTFLTPLVSQINGGPDVSPVPSPDGRTRIVFVDNTPDGLSDVFLMDLDGSDRINLTATTERAEMWAAWSPDATRLGCTTLSLDPTTLFEDCFVFDLALVSGQVAIVQESSLLNVAGSPLQGGTSLAWPTWAHTSNHVALTAKVPSGGSGYDIWIIDVDDPAQAQNLTGAFGKVERSAVFAPDDSAMAYWRSGPGHDGVYRLDAGSSDPVLLYKNGKVPSWRGF